MSRQDNSAAVDAPFHMTAEEEQRWQRDGYFVRENVFSHEENDQLRAVAEDVVAGKRKMHMVHIDQNALVRDGKDAKDARKGIYAMHKIHHPSCFIPEFLARVRDPRLTDPLVDILGPDILGINNLFIWKAPEIGLGFPWHQDKFYFGKRFKTATTVGTWTAIDPADRENGCLYVIPGSHQRTIVEHDDIEGSQQSEFKLARNTRDEDGIPVEVPPGAVIWFHSHLLHKSTDNHSQRFRRSYVAHYLSAQAEWMNPEKPGRGQPIMSIRGQTFPGKVQEVERDVLHPGD
jgi:phytanoyl-CoA hydroxylase